MGMVIGGLIATLIAVTWFAWDRYMLWKDCIDMAATLTLECRKQVNRVTEQDDEIERLRACIERRDATIAELTKQAKEQD